MVRKIRGSLQAKHLGERECDQRVTAANLHAKGRLVRADYIASFLQPLLGLTDCWSGRLIARSRMFYSLAAIADVLGESEEYRFC